MKGLKQFLKFDNQRFFNGKKFICADCRDWVDYKSKDVVGTRVDALCVQDDTEYALPKDGVPISNKYERFTFKIEGKKLSVPVDAQIAPINPQGSIYGEYQNSLSIRVDDIRVAQPKG